MNFRLPIYRRCYVVKFLIQKYLWDKQTIRMRPSFCPIPSADTLRDDSIFSLNFFGKKQCRFVFLEVPRSKSRDVEADR